jgi:hypothetical protein
MLTNIMTEFSCCFQKCDTKSFFKFFPFVGVDRMANFQAIFVDFSLQPHNIPLVFLNYFCCCIFQRLDLVCIDSMCGTFILCLFSTRGRYGI